MGLKEPPVATKFQHIVWFIINLWWIAGIILGMGAANDRRRNNVTLSFIGWAHAQNVPWIVMSSLCLILITSFEQQKSKHIIPKFYIWNTSSDLTDLGLMIYNMMFD